MLIRNAQVWGHGHADLRIKSGRITAIGHLAPQANEPIIAAQGGLLIPGLHDHHIHLAATAAQRASVPCGPPHVADSEALARQLSQAARTLPAGTWLRGTGFCESLTDNRLPNSAFWDRCMSDHPLRVQHRTGRMWFFNTRALDMLLALAPPPQGLERDSNGFTGRLFDEDIWLHNTLKSLPPDFALISTELAAFGVTGITDMSPRNDTVIAQHFAQQRQSGKLLQAPVLAGTLALAQEQADEWALGPAKLHLHESALPNFDDALTFIEQAHTQGRGVAIHCVTEVELVFALALWEASGASGADRVEHVSVASPELVARMAGLGVATCVQPHFIAERGDRYLADVEPRHHPDLYRLASLRDAGLAMAGGSDAPYGRLDPWHAMAAAVLRTTPNGVPITPAEALSPEEALALYWADPHDLSCTRTIAIGAPADLCLLHHSQADLLAMLTTKAPKPSVALTLSGGKIIHHSIDQAPFQSLSSVDPAA